MARFAHIFCTKETNIDEYFTCHFILNAQAQDTHLENENGLNLNLDFQTIRAQMNE